MLWVQEDEHEMMRKFYKSRKDDLLKTGEQSVRLTK